MYKKIILLSSITSLLGIFREHSKNRRIILQKIFRSQLLSIILYIFLKKIYKTKNINPYKIIIYERWFMLILKGVFDSFNINKKSKYLLGLL